MRLLRKYFLIIIGLVSFVGIPAVSLANGATLAIFNFRAANIEALMYNGEILYTLLSALEREKGIKLMPRRQMEAILSQNNLVQSDHPEIVIKAGQALGTDFILFGSVDKKADILAKLKLMDIANRRVVRTWQLRFSEPQKISEQAPSTARQLATTILSAKPGANNTNAQASDNIKNFRVQSMGKNILLTWQSNSVHPVIAFKIYRGTTPGGPFQFIGKTTTNRLVDETYESGSTYYYRIGTMLKSDQEVLSHKLAKIEKAGERLPYPPLIMSFDGRVRAGEIKFVPALQNMKAKFDIVSYKIYRHDPAIDEWTLIQTVNARVPSSKLVFSVKDTHAMKDGATYRYALTSIDKQGRESPRSDSIAVQTAPSPRLEIAQNNLTQNNLTQNNLTQNNLISQIDLAWNPIANIKGYNLYRSLSDNGGSHEWEKIAQIKDNRTEKYADVCSNEPVGLSRGISYLYRLTAYDDGGETAPSDVVEGRCKAIEPRTSKEAPRSDIETVQPNLGDNSSPNDIIEPRTSKEAPKSDIETVQPNLGDNSSPNDIIEPRTSKEAPRSDIETVQQNLADNSSPNDIVALPGSPVLGVARDDQLRQIDLVWRAVTNTDGYHIYRKAQGTDWHKIATITVADQSYYTDTANLDDGQTYHYYLTAFTSEEETEPSQPVTAKTKGTPSCPEKISVSWQSNKGVKITWTPLNDPDVGGYVIYRGSSAGQSEHLARQSVSVKEIAQVKGWQSNSYIDQEILSPQPGREYYYAMKSFNLFNARGVFSEAVRVKTEP